MKLVEYLKTLQIEENTAVGIRINQNHFGNVINTVGDIAQYWSYNDDRDFYEAIDGPEMAWQYEHRSKYHELSDHSLSQLQPYFNYEVTAITPMNNHHNVPVYMTTEPDENSPLGNPLMFDWNQKLDDHNLEEYRGNILIINIVIEKPKS